MIVGRNSRVLSRVSSFRIKVIFATLYTSYLKHAAIEVTSATSTAVGVATFIRRDHASN